MTGQGSSTLYEFVDELLSTKDQQISSQVSCMLGQHGDVILNAIRKRQRDLVKKWAIDLTGELLAGEGRKLAECLRPEKSQKTSSTLEEFSLDRIMADAELLAPNLCRLLRAVSDAERPAEDKTRKNRSLVCVCSFDLRYRVCVLKHLIRFSLLSFVCSHGCIVNVLVSFK